MKQTPGKIFVADQRGMVETNQFRRYSTFNFGAYFQEYKTPFGRLHALNEETLAGTHSLELVATEAVYVLVLPITGAVQVSGPQAAASVEVEEVQLLALPANGAVRFTNPYETELISFLHLWLIIEPAASALTWQRFTFDSQHLENQLVEVVPAANGEPAPRLPFSLSLGRFAGRHEAVYTGRKAGACFFAFVLAGAFELEGRLLHEKDGLALWETNEFELEALSNNAFILILEMEE